MGRGWTIYNSQGVPLITSKAHNHTAADGSGPLTDDEHDGFSEYGEIAAPGAGAANKLRLYALDGPDVATGGRATVPSFVDSAGVTTIIDSGTYSPTITNILNAAASTAFTCMWLRIGNIVTVAGKFNCDPTNANTKTLLEITLPVASNFTNENDVGGACGCRSFEGSGLMFGDVANNNLSAEFHPTSATNAAWGFTCTYVIK